MAAFLCLALIYFFPLLTGEQLQFAAIYSVTAYILLILFFPHQQPIYDTLTRRVFCCNHLPCLLSSYHSKALKKRSDTAVASNMSFKILSKPQAQHPLALHLINSSPSPGACLLSLSVCVSLLPLAFLLSHQSK